MDTATFTPYRPEPGRFDELTDERGHVRAGWSSLVDTLGRLGPQQVRERRVQAERLLVAEGASHVVHDDGHDASRPWHLDPVPLVIDGPEWARLEEGLVQRARLLDAVLDDLYGDCRLLVERVVPRELVFGTRAWFPSCHRVVPAGGRRLAIYGADVVRDGQGRLRVLADHTDAPAGAGYAVLNRHVLSRLFPDAYRGAGVRRLDDWMADLRAGLATLAPRDRPSPRVVVLTPGAGHPSYFEHSYLASYLGYNLVEGADLAVRDGRVWLRALGGLEPVDVLLRRVEDAAADALQMDTGRRGGVPGLVESAREQRVGVANATGSRLVENPALHGYLAAVCERMLGERLLLPALATLWCGDPDQRHEVRKHLDRMVLYDTDPLATEPSVFGSDLTDGGAAAWLDRMEAAPHRYAAQEKVVFATTPTIDGTRIVPAVAVIRAQVAATTGGYAALPGGLGRIMDPARPVLAQSTGIGKDVWVRADERDGGRRRHRSDGVVPQVDLRGSLPSRAAEALFWLGRNAERAEAVARLAGVIILRAQEDPALAAETSWRDRLLGALRAASGGDGDGPSIADPFAAIRAEVAAATAERSAGVAASLARVRAAALSVRQFLSTTTWRVLAMLEHERDALAGGGADNLDAVSETLERTVLGLTALAGLATDSTVRGPAWRFLDTGRRLERALVLVRVVESTLVPAPDRTVLQPLSEAVLSAAESLVEYRRRYRSDIALDAVVDLLLCDDTNPRSLVFQLDRIREDVAGLPTPDALPSIGRLDDAARALLDAPTTDLHRLLLDTRGPLLDFVDEFVRDWFSDASGSRRYHRGAG